MLDFRFGAIIGNCSGTVMRRSRVFFVRRTLGFDLDCGRIVICYDLNYVVKFRV